MMRRKSDAGFCLCMFCGAARYIGLCFFVLLCACGTRKVDTSKQQTVQVQQQGEFDTAMFTGVSARDSLLQQRKTETYVRHIRLSAPDSAGFQYPESVTEVCSRERNDVQQVLQTDSVSGFVHSGKQTLAVQGESSVTVKEKSDTRAFSLSFRIVAGILIFLCVFYFCVRPLFLKKNLHNE